MNKIWINPTTNQLRGIWKIIIFLLAFLAILSALNIMILLPIYLLAGIRTPDEVTARFGSYWPMAFNWCMFLVALLIASWGATRWLDHRPFKTIGFELHKGWWKELLLGLLAGMVILAVVVLLLRLTGRLSFSTQPLSFSGTLRALVSSLFLFLIAAAAEEVMLRGFPFQALMRDHGPLLALIFTSIIFGLGHIWNPNVSALAIVNTVLAGVWLGISYLNTGNLWFPIAMHCGWNFAMDSIFGLEVSGLDLGPSILREIDKGPQWLTGMNYGPEAGIGATAILIAASILLWRTRWPSGTRREAEASKQ